MPTSKPSPEASARGFTLVEMLVVLAIASLAAVLFVGASGNSAGSLEARKDTAAFENEIAKARRLAVQSGKAQQVNISASGTRFVPTIGDAQQPIFYADGSSNGGALRKGKKDILKIRWFDGAITK